jgi:hypothetical protein
MDYSNQLLDFARQVRLAALFGIFYEESAETQADQNCGSLGLLLIPGAQASGQQIPRFQ